MAKIVNDDLEVVLEILLAFCGIDPRFNEINVRYEIMLYFQGEPVLNPKLGKLHSYWVAPHSTKLSDFIKEKLDGKDTDNPWYQADDIPHILVSAIDSDNKEKELIVRSQIPFMEDYMCMEDTGISFHFTASVPEWDKFLAQLAAEENYAAQHKVQNSGM